MKKVIVLSAVLGLGALGMACGGAENTNNAKPANNTMANNASTPVTVSTPAPMNTNTTTTNTTNTNAKPANTTTTNTNKPANTPANANTKKTP